MLQNPESIPAELREQVQRWWERASAQPRWNAIYAALAPAYQQQLPIVVAG
ncbi:MAG: hypothetical protein QOF42_1886, partial [Gammaproteobacteria bacterium]|nr:hypothetical protein [Gammaproteobacteria bacterium]